MNELLFDKLKDYYSGNMNRQERLQFEAEMKTNKELAIAVELYQTIDKGIFDEPGEFSGEEAASIRSTLNEAHERFTATERLQDAEQSKTKEEEQYAPETGLKKNTRPLAEASKAYAPTETKGNVKNISVWKILAAAAVITGIVAITSIWYFQREKESTGVAAGTKKEGGAEKVIITDKAQPSVSIPSGDIATQDKNKTPVQRQDSPRLAQPFVPGKAEREALYARNFKADALPPGYSDLLQEALNRYKNGAYKDAVAAIDIEAIKTSLEELRPRGGQQDEKLETEEKQTLFYAHYYKALSYMAGNNTEKAIPEFRNALANSPDKFWQSKAQWYLALAYIKTGKIKEAKMLLKQVAGTVKSGKYQPKASTLINELEGNNAR